ncbi:SCAN domain-containing protein 3 [Eumeta japonica]|uniref:SCAN domain-containing protein 3 n=1 Tax=Eumeta variegata TaxID=151549 RepID=A0A4C1V7R4_EUMVA|nr:SCAN domain-containing protein 3 [Eumeta japonica]
MGEKYEKRPTVHSVFSSTSESNDDGLRSSYNISLLIAKSEKPHTIEEQLILPAVEKVLKTVLHKSSLDILKRIPLSDNTIQRRIDEMSSDLESFLCDYLRTTHFSIQLDESTIPANEALLLAYVRFIMGEEVHEELLFAKILKTGTKVVIYEFAVVLNQRRFVPLCIWEHFAFCQRDTASTPSVSIESNQAAHYMR